MIANFFRRFGRRTRTAVGSKMNFSSKALLLGGVSLAVGSFVFTTQKRRALFHQSLAGLTNRYVAICSSSSNIEDELKHADELFDQGVDKVGALHASLLGLAERLALPVAAIESCGADQEKLAKLVMPESASPKQLAHVLWRLSRSSRLVSQDDNLSWSEREKHAILCHAFAFLAVQSDNEVWEAHKWLGVSYSCLGDFLGIKKKLQNSFFIRSEFEKAVEIFDQDATTLHLLGYWYFYFADMSWFERNIAATLFSSPPEGSYDKALNYLERSAKLDPNYIRNCYYLALVHARLGHDDKSKVWKEKCLSLPSVSRDDEEFQLLAKKL